MKIRNGFVSNSSSSSFIIGIAKIDDIKQFRDYLNEKGIVDVYDIEIMSKSDLMVEKPWNIEVRDNKAYLESFNGDTVTLNIGEMSPLDTFVTYYFTGHDDSDFWDGDEYDYDIDFTLFDTTERMIYNMFSDKESGLDIKNSQVSYGAGRNG